MVKINLLDINEDRVIFEKGSDLSMKDKPAKEEREFSLESVDELFKNSQTSKQSEPINEAKKEWGKEVLVFKRNDRTNSCMGRRIR